MGPRRARDSVCRAVVHRAEAGTNPVSSGVHAGAVCCTSGAEQLVQYD